MSGPVPNHLLPPDILPHRVRPLTERDLMRALTEMLHELIEDRGHDINDLTLAPEDDYGDASMDDFSDMSRET